MVMVLFIVIIKRFNMIRKQLLIFGAISLLGLDARVPVTSDNSHVREVEREWLTAKDYLVIYNFVPDITKKNVFYKDKRINRTRVMDWHKNEYLANRSVGDMCESSASGINKKKRKKRRCHSVNMEHNGGNVRGKSAVLKDYSNKKTQVDDGKVISGNLFFGKSLSQKVREYSVPLFCTFLNCVLAWIAVPNPNQMSDCIQIMMKYSPLLGDGEIADVLKDDNNDNANGNVLFRVGKMVLNGVIKGLYGVKGDLLVNIIGLAYDGLKDDGVLSSWSDRIRRSLFGTGGAFVKNGMRYIVIYNFLRDRLFRLLHVKGVVIPDKEYGLFDRLCVTITAALRAYMFR